MSRINLNIVATGNFSSVNAQLDQLRRTVAQINSQSVGVGLSKAQIDNIQRATSAYDSLLHSTGAFSRQMVNVQDQTAKFGRELEAGKLKLGQYFQIWSRGNNDARRQLKELAAQQVALQSAVVRTDPAKMGKAYVDMPRVMADTATKTALARKQQELFNLSLKTGGEAMINWGKNTQWAGRQLTVGLTVPLMMFGQKAANAFKDFDQQMTRMIKVYGDGITGATTKQLQTIRSQVTDLAGELAKNWGVAMKDTAATASDLAATGITGVKLLNATKEATRLATLGELDRQDAIKATIALQTTFNLNSRQLAQSVDFLNATENATSTSLQDLVDAIPRAGTVVKALGGDYKELTVMMVAMREAGVSSGEAANAIKSTLGALINPTKKTREEFQKFGIDLRSVRDAANGDPVKMFASLGAELNRLDKISKSRLIETLFGKYQFARVTALIDNLGTAGSQTQKVFKLMGASVSQMSANSQREMDALANSVSKRYERAMENFTAKIMPIGEKFLTVATDIMDRIAGVLDFIDKHPGLKNFLSGLAPILGFVGPVIMLTGVFGNFIGYLLKGIGTFKNLGNGFKGFAEIATAESVAAANAGNLFQQSLVSQSEAAVVLQEAISALNRQLLEYRGLISGIGGPGPSGPIPPMPSGGGGGGRPPTRPSGPVILGGGVEPSGTPPKLIIPGQSGGGGELIVPGRPERVVVSAPASAALGGSAPIAPVMGGSQLDQWQPRAEPTGGRRGTTILHSTSRQALVNEIVYQAIQGSTLGQKLEQAGQGQGPLADAFREKQERARQERLRKMGGSAAITPEDFAAARRNLIDEIVTRGAWSAKGAPPSGAAAAINSAIGNVPQNFSMPSAATLSAAGISLTPEMEKQIMLQQLRAWGGQAGSGALGKVEDIISGKGKTQLSGPELQSWLGSQSRMPQAGRAFVDTTMAKAEEVMSKHQGRIDENLVKLYNEATAAAGSGDWEATRTATSKLHDHLKTSYQHAALGLEERAAEVERQYDRVFKEAYGRTDVNADVTERVRIAAGKAQLSVDELLDNQGRHVAEQFATNEKAFKAASSELGIPVRYSRQGMGEVVTAAAGRAVAAAEQVTQAERNVGNAVAESINESNAAMQQAANAEAEAARIVRSGSTGTPPGLIIPGRPEPGRSPGKIILPKRRAMGGPTYYGPGGGVSGPGGPKDDLIPAYLSNGEFVIRADSVNKIGVDNLRHMNETGMLPSMAMGGYIRRLKNGGTGNYDDERRSAYPPELMPTDKMWKLLQDNPVDGSSDLLSANERKIVRAHLKKILGEDFENNKGQVEELLKTIKKNQLRDRFGLELSHIIGGKQKVKPAAKASLLLPTAENQLMKSLATSAAGWKIDHADPRYKDTLWSAIDRTLSEEDKDILKKIVGARGGSSLTWEERNSSLKAVQSLIDQHNDPKNSFRFTNTRTLLHAYQTRAYLGTFDTRQAWEDNARKAAEHALRSGYSAKKVAETMKSAKWMKSFFNISRGPWRRGFFANGGAVYGSGGPVSDQIPAMLSNGEYVVSAKGHQAAGTRFLDAINNGQFTMGYARGGRVKYKNGIRAFVDGDDVNPFEVGRPTSLPPSVARGAVDLGGFRGKLESAIESGFAKGFDTVSRGISKAIGGRPDEIMTYAEHVAEDQGIDTKAVRDHAAAVEQSTKAELAQKEAALADAKQRQANYAARGLVSKDLEEEIRDLESDIRARKAHTAALNQETAQLNESNPAATGGSGRGRGKDKDRMGMGKGFGLGMALSTAGGMAMMSENKDIQSAGNVMTYAGMATMIHPAVGGLVLALGAGKMVLDKYFEGIAANADKMTEFTQRFAQISQNEQGFLGIELKTFAEQRLAQLTDRTDEATSAVKQFAEAIKDAAVGTVEYARKQIFAQANTAQELFADPAFQKLFNSMQIQLQGSGLKPKEQEARMQQFLEGYLRSVGKEVLIPSVNAMAKQKQATPWAENVAETAKASQKTFENFNKAFPNVTTEGVKKYSEIAAAYEAFTGGKGLQFGKEGQNLGSVGALVSATGGYASSDPLSLLVAQLLGQGAGGVQGAMLGGEKINLNDPVMRKKAMTLVDAVLGPGWQDVYQADSGFFSGTAFGGEKITKKGLSSYANINLGQVASEQLSAAIGGNISNADFTNSLTNVQEQMNAVKSSAKGLFDQFAMDNTSFMVENLNDLVRASGDSESALSGIEETLVGDEKAQNNFNDALAATGRGIQAGILGANQLVNGLTRTSAAAAAAALDLEGLGYNLNKLDFKEITIVINRVIRTREIAAYQATRTAEASQTLEEAFRQYQENVDLSKQDTGGGSSGGGSSGGGGGYSPPPFNSKPYDDAIKAQQKLIEKINEEREARQKLAAAQKENEDFMLTEYGLKKKIAESQATGDFLGAYEAQLALGKAKSDKAKADAERAKTADEDRQIKAAQKEIERLQEALAAAQKAYDKANQGGGGGGSSGGGGGGGGGTSAPSLPPLPEGVTAAGLQATARAGISQEVAAGNWNLADILTKNKTVAKQFKLAAQIMGKDAAKELFNGFIEDAQVNILGISPALQQPLATLNEKLMQSPVFAALPEEQKGMFQQKILDFMGDISKYKDIDTASKALKEKLKLMGLDEATANTIATSFLQLGPKIKEAVNALDTAGAAQVLFDKMKELFPNLPDYGSLTEEQRQILSQVVTQIAAGASPSPEEIKALSEALLPRYANTKAPSKGRFKGRQDSSAQGDKTAAQNSLSEAVTELIGPATAAGEAESKKNPIGMSSQVYDLLVPPGTITFNNGTPSFTATGPPQDVLPNQNIETTNKAYGGYISGPGGPRDDLIPAKLSNGEYVIQANAVSHYGAGFMDAINQRKFAKGGMAKDGKLSKKAMDVVMGRMMGVPGFMEKDTTLKFATGGYVNPPITTVPNADFISKVEPLAEKYQGTPYSSKVPGDPSGWGCATSVYWLYRNGMGVTLPDSSMSDGLLHSNLPNVPIDGPYAPGDLVLQYNPKGVNTWADANHTEMVLSGGRKWNGGVGIQSLDFRYDIKGVKRPVNSGFKAINFGTGNASYPMFNDTMKLTLPQFHTGGAVGYSKGGDVMAMVQGGEVVVPTKTVDKVNPLLDALTNGKMGLGEITNNITINGANHSPQVIAQMVVGEIEKSMKRTVSVNRIS